MSLSLVLLTLMATAQTDGPSAPPANIPPEKVRSVTVFGDDPCPKPSSDDEVIVCGRLDENDRYRIPKEFRDDGSAADAPSASWKRMTEVVDEVNRVSLPGSCSVVGSWGQSGCNSQFIDLWRAGRVDQLRKAGRVP